MKYLLIILVALTSCGTQRQIKKCQKCYDLLPPVKTEIKDSVNIIFDTVTHVIEIPADTSKKIIIINCDSLGNATIKSETTNNGNRSRITTSLKNNELSIQATCKMYLDSVQLLKTTINRLRTETNTVFVPKLVEAKLTRWQRIKVDYGGYAFGLIASYIAFSAISFYAKSKNPLVWLSRLKRH
jgi:hypothetical protein